MYMLLISGSISLYFHFISPHTLQCKFLSQFGRWQYLFISFHFYFWSLSISISLSTDCSCCSISCSAPPLSQLNVGPIAKRRPFQCFNVSTHLLLPTIPSLPILPACQHCPLFFTCGFVHKSFLDLFLGCLSICSQSVVDLGFNWKGGFAAQSAPYLLLCRIHISERTRLGCTLRTCRRVRRRLPGDGQQILSQVVHVLAGQTCYQCQICNRWSRTCIWAKIPSVTDASAPRFHQCSPNYKYQQLLSFMAV